MSGDIEMKKVIHFLKSLVCPSVDETLDTFHQKIISLNKRVDLNVDEINSADELIDALHDKKQVLLLDIAKAENAIEFLNKING